MQLRPFRWDDLAALTDLYNAANEADGDPRQFTVAEVETFMREPNYDPTRDQLVIDGEGSALAACADVYLVAGTGKIWGDCVVHPAYRGQGMGTRLLASTDALGVERTQAEAPADAPIYIMRSALDTNQAALDLLERAGYQHNRTFYTMRIDFNGAAVEVAPPPDGVTIRPFERERDTYSVYEAHQESFQDHWGFVRLEFDHWKHLTVDHPATQLDFWWVAQDGAEVAGVCLGRPFGAGDPAMGYVNTLAVRRPWRKRGLGSALLQQAFARFQARGFQRVALGVDGQSPTNAVALYERAGMYVYKRRLNFRKIFRGSDADIHD